MVWRCFVLLLLTVGSFPVKAQVNTYLPFGARTLASFKSSIPIGDILNQKALSPERKEELNTQFLELSDSISRAPQNGALYFQRGIIRMELGALRGALDDFDLARSLGHRKHETYFQLGVVNAALGERPSALAYFNICLKKDSTDSGVHFYVGVTKLYLRHGTAEERCTEAIPEFSKALQYNSSLRDAFILRGCAYDRLGEHGLAVTDFKKALEMSPGNPTIMLLIGQATLDNH